VVVSLSGTGQSSSSRTSRKSSAIYFYIFLFLVLIGILRIAHTYTVLWQTWDEPAHISTGLEWLETGEYHLEHQHPPLGRVFSALFPYMSGIRLTGAPEMYSEGNNLLHQNGTYERNLTLARIGILPFFVLIASIIWIWAKRLFGPMVALVSVFLLTTLPPLLAHAGLATTDLPAAAMFVTAIYMLDSWLARPTARNSCLLGASVGGAFISKFSNIPFFVSSCVLLAAVFYFKRNRNKNERTWKVYFSRSLIAVASCILFIWAGYHFSFGPISGFSVPAPEFFSGIKEVVQHNREGHVAYLLGETYTEGKWYFFPIAIAVKTPVPFLILGVIGLFTSLKDVTRNRLQLLLVPVAIVAVLVMCMFSNLNLGVRHVLPVYALLAFLGGVGALRVWQFRAKPLAGPLIVTTLLVWQSVAAFSAHPDYLAYYNLFAGGKPENIVLDTSDWGQDVKRLKQTLQKRGITDYSFCYYGSADFQRLGLPPGRKLIPNQPTTGWVAASLLCNKMGAWEYPYNQFAWLDQYQPVESIGKSIRLYYIPDSLTAN
jgi:4-amino-4-deoxy-L-arabinose transferase-like glycosyltransferase